jgi:pimeloyl-ACP methyl ester carboxylesterase
MIDVFILLGGLTGGQGEQLVNVGMRALALQLQQIPGMRVTQYPWGEYERVALNHHYDSVVVIGYSGGGSRATWLADEHPLTIDLMVLYDPSPAWQMKPLKDNVKRAICYHNTNPMFGRLGGGILRGPHVETIDIAEFHLTVETNPILHARTIAAVKELL